MNKTVVAIQSYGKARDTVWRHFPFYLRSGCDLLGVNTTDTIHDWPEGCPTIEIGRDGYLDGTDHLCRRMLDTLEYLLREPRYQNHTHFMLIEHDSVFVRHVPQFEPGLTTPYPGFCPKGWAMNSIWFIHSPWIMDRETALLMVDAGHALLERGIFDKGTPDAFIGSIISEAAERGIRWNQYGQDKTTMSVNSGSFSEGETGQKLRRSFEKRLREEPDLWFLHGVKSTEELDWLRPLLP
jgi:hypothetical protein